MSVQTISPLPTPPSRQSPVDFAAKGDAFLAALPTFVTQANALANEVNFDGIQVGIAASASAASASASASSAASSQNFSISASNSAANAAASSTAPRWLSTTNYALGALAWSPIDGRVYRRLVAGTSATDPSADSTNWVRLSFVVESEDIGTAPNQIPLNQTLGGYAFMSPESFVARPASSANPLTPSGMVFQLTNNTTLVVKVMGSDGVIRSNTLTLS